MMSVSQASDRKALISLLTCVGGLLAVVALVLAISIFNAWPLVMKGLDAAGGAAESVHMFLLNLLEPVAAPVAIVLLLAFMLSLCLTVKGFDENPPEGAAAWRIRLSKILGGESAGLVMFLLLVCAIPFGALAEISAENGGEESMAVYADLVVMEREQLFEHSYGKDLGAAGYSGWAARLGKSGEASRTALRSTCRAWVRSTPASTPYVLTVNGIPAGPDSCGWGVNRLVWSSK